MQYRAPKADELSNRWQTDPRWKGIRRDYTAKDVTELRGSVHVESTLARRGAERLWKLLHTEPYVHALGALTGNQAVQMVEAGLKAIYLSGWQVAADANNAGQMYPDQSLYPADSVPALVRSINNAFRRADQIQHVEGRDDDRLLPADRGRRRGRFRRPAQCLRADEGHDRSRRGRRPLRRPARQREEVRAHGRQGAGAHAAVHSHAHCRATGRRRDGRAHGAGGPDRRRQSPSCSPATSTNATGRSSPASARRRASSRIDGGLGVAIDRGLSYAPYADLLWCETSEPDLAEAAKFAEAIHAEVPRQAAGLQLLAVVQLEEEARRGDDRPLPARAGRDGLQVPVHHAGRLPRPEPVDVRAGPRLPRRRHDGLRGGPAARVRPRGRQATIAPPSTSGSSAPATSTRWPSASPAASRRPRPCTARPKRHSSNTWRSGALIGNRIRMGAAYGCIADRQPTTADSRVADHRCSSAVQR